MVQSGQAGSFGRQILTAIAEKVDPRWAALLVIDVQNDFVHEDGFASQVGWDVTRQQEASKRTADLVVEARKRGVRVIFVRGIYDDAYMGDPWVDRNERQGLDTPRCIEGSWGADFYLVEPAPDEIVITKHRYSAFINTDLEMVLKRFGVKTLISTGIHTDGCVESTVRHGYFLDYYNVVVSDCCGTRSEAAHLASIDVMNRLFGVVIDFNQLVEAWDKAAAKRPGSTMKVN